MDKAYYEKLWLEFETSPFWVFMKITIESLEEGSVKLVMPPSENYVNLNGGVHGGVLTSLLDSVMGLTVRSTWDVPAVTQSLTVQFLRAPKPDETLFASGTVVKAGRTVASIEGHVFGKDGRLLAIGIGTFMKVPGA